MLILIWIFCFIISMTMVLKLLLTSLSRMLVTGFPQGKTSQEAAGEAKGWWWTTKLLSLWQVLLLRQLKMNSVRGWVAPFLTTKRKIRSFCLALLNSPTHQALLALIIITPQWGQIQLAWWWKWFRKKIFDVMSLV